MNDDDLGARLKHAVSDVEPTPALDALQRRTTGGGRSARTWLGVLGAAAAVAVIVSGIAVVERSTQPDTTGGGFPAPRPSNDGGPKEVKGVGYFVGDTVPGPRLYAESRTYRGDPGASDLQVVVSAVVRGDTDDGDLRSAFPIDTTAKVSAGDSAYVVDLFGDATTIAAAPADGSGDVGVQAVLRTVQGIAGGASLVTFRINGTKADTVLGVDTRAAVRKQSDDDVMAPVRIDAPGNSTTVGRTFTVSGEAATFEANVQWELKQGSAVVRQGFTTATECCTASPYEFTVQEAPIGQFTLVVHDTDESGDGGPVNQDTKEITVVGGGANGNGR